ncbi:MAG: hypothetical protein C5B46_08570 [Proteobacteria bacterium]|nr:MAG: hypothetical protein C5B46_08570 [Pseudomonadota bacterium]
MNGVDGPPAEGAFIEKRHVDQEAQFCFLSLSPEAVHYHEDRQHQKQTAYDSVASSDRHLDL